MSDDVDATVPHAFHPGLPTDVLPDRQQEAPVVAFVSDLMLASRLEGASIQAGIALTVAADQAAAEACLVARSPAVVLDLTDPAFPFTETCARIRAAAPDACIIAFYPHVRDELRAMAKDAGCEVVMPRSRFLTDPVSALRSGLDLAASRADHAAGVGGHP